jgi:ATP-dependent Clp protease ATP-binding subunit ClpA
MILEPSEDLQTIFDKAIDIAINYQHEYLTIEHLVLAIFSDEKFIESISKFTGDIEYVKVNLEHFIKNNLNSIVSENKNIHPQKTQSVERCLNRAFTQVLFNGRQKIEVMDLLISIMSERKSHAVFLS